MVEAAVGLIAIVFAIQRIRAEHRGVPARLGRAWEGVAMGAAAGFTSQIAHAGGPPFQMHVLPKKLPRDMFIGTSTVFFAVIRYRWRAAVLMMMVPMNVVRGDNPIPMTSATAEAINSM